MTPVRQRFASTGALLLHLSRLLGFALLFSTLLMLFALLVAGLPEHLTRKITTQLHAAGIPLRFDSVRLSTHRGWVLNNARLYSKSPDDLEPVFSAKKLYLWAWPLNWSNLQQTDWHLRIFVRDLSVSFGRAWDLTLPEKHPFSTVSKLKASLTAGRNRLSLDRLSLLWGGINIETQGTITIPQESAVPVRSGELRRRAAQALDSLSRLQFEQPPDLTLNISADTARPEDLSATAQFSADGFIWNGTVYDRLSGGLQYRNRQLTLSDLRLIQSPVEEFAVRGTIHPADSNALLYVVNTLPASDLLRLLPDGPPPFLETAGLDPSGPLHFSATLGPAPLSALEEKIDVQVQHMQLRRDDLLLDPLAFRLIRDGSRLLVTNIQARANGGPLGGTLSFDLDTNAWIAHVQAQCNPYPLGPLIGGGFQKFLRRFEFPNEPPQADLHLSQTEPGQPLTITGRLLATRFFAGGVPVGQTQTSIAYSNRWLQLPDLHVSRDNRQLTGNVQLDLNNQLALFSLTNSFPPSDIARALLPDRSTPLDRIRFNGPITSAGSGQIAYGHATNHIVRATFRGEQISMENLTADRFQTDLLVSGTELLFTNTAAHLYKGTADGSAQFDLLTSDGSAPYRLDARFTRLDLTQLLRAVSTNTPGRTQGELSGSVRLTANAKTGFWNSARGFGSVRVQKGHLADIPLFGGFSRLLRSTFPAFNVFSLNAFSADYQLHDGAVHSSNAKLGGTLLSATGRGKWSPDTGLDFIVTAEPLRQTRDDKAWYQVQLWAADMLKLGTAPLFYLLEFQLEGPLSNPEWRFVNLPR